MRELIEVRPVGLANIRAVEITNPIIPIIVIVTRKRGLLCSGRTDDLIRVSFADTRHKSAFCSLTHRE
jgi:hypothetical protein